MAASCVSAGPNNANADRRRCRHDLPCWTLRRRLELIQSLRWDNRIRQATDLLNPDFDDVARLQVLRRIHAEADTRWCSGEDHVARIESDVAGDELDQFGGLKDNLIRA